VVLTSLRRSSDRVRVCIDDQQRRLTVETLEELEWCLEQLETMQTHRSVADMAAVKVRFCHISTYLSPTVARTSHAAPRVALVLVFIIF